MGKLGLLEEIEGGLVGCGGGGGEEGVAGEWRERQVAWREKFEVALGGTLDERLRVRNGEGDERW